MFSSKDDKIEKIWFERIQGEPHTTPWEKYPLSSLYSRMEAIHQEIVDWLSELSDEALVAGVLHYTNTKGQAYSNSWIEILAHLVNHSTHHRAQIAARIRELGMAPPPTDYIFFKRK